MRNLLEKIFCNKIFVWAVAIGMAVGCIFVSIVSWGDPTLPQWIPFAADGIILPLFAVVNSIDF